MIKETIIGTISLVSTVLLPVSNTAIPLLSPIPEYLLIVNKEEDILAEHQLDLTIREPNPYANQVFADNILLALHYLRRDPPAGGQVDWEGIRQPFEVSFALQPGEVFAFHGNILEEFSPPAGGPAVTMNSRFFIEEGYRSVGGLGGNGVCHLASLINWVATEAGLEVKALANHNFAPIPGVPKQFGTSIRSQNPNQNLYIKNNFDFPVIFVFTANSREVGLKITK